MRPTLRTPRSIRPLKYYGTASVSMLAKRHTGEIRRFGTSALKKEEQRSAADDVNPSFQDSTSTPEETKAEEVKTSETQTEDAASPLPDSTLEESSQRLETLLLEMRSYIGPEKFDQLWQDLDVDEEGHGKLEALLRAIKEEEEEGKLGLDEYTGNMAKEDGMLWEEWAKLEKEYGEHHTQTDDASSQEARPQVPSETQQLSPEQMALMARQKYGDRLPADMLTEEELQIYKRLYGTPLKAYDHNKQDLGENIKEKEGGATLMRQNVEGGLEEIDGESSLLPSANAEEAEEHVEEDYETKDVKEYALTPEELAQYPASHFRTHPLTALGRFSSERTIFLPQKALVKPVSEILSESSNKHISEAALKAFGGPLLPFSTSTPVSKRHIQQQPIPLSSSQHNMTEQEGNAFVAALYPGNYATASSILLELRKRLGADWIPQLLAKPGGPKVLDVGSGGAGVIAWREVLKAEWLRIAEGGQKEMPIAALGKATVIAGSSTLRHRASRMLENTTFLPRLPDYVHVKDPESTQRKQFDVIIAPNTLWSFKEDWMRKQHVQNLWSLLDRNGGILILIEKGLSRGFEMIAGAREMLLNRYILSPDEKTDQDQSQEDPDEPIEAHAGQLPTKKEPGQILAPCTNHVQCPMFLHSGHSSGRKDFCHFSQRYIRPPFLQRLVGATSYNHEDVRFSYIAVRRGRDMRREFDEQTGGKLVQGEEATGKAFKGFEIAQEETKQQEDVSSSSLPSATETEAQPASTPSSPSTDTNTHIDTNTNINTLSLPRAILPPIKRRGHVILDLCTPSGRIERWTVPRSHSRQAYRDARKSQWGDLWALGAKTRIPRNIRIGIKKVRKGKTVDVNEEDLNGDEDAKVGVEGGFDFGDLRDLREMKALRKTEKRKRVKRARGKGDLNLDKRGRMRGRGKRAEEDEDEDADELD
ncbi:MAG: 37S ribosomal protein S22 [Cirrosporium novae-zelandiae]|nr:MAG: 37S ribosomal protein S22 [Cirrosporium novae-zelandiae]